MAAVNRDQVIAFRIASQHLGGRLPPDSVTTAAAIGIQETPLGSAALALAARVEGLTPELVDSRIADRELVGVWSVRGAPYLIPSADFDVFTLGAFPQDPASLPHTLGGWAKSLDDAGVDPHQTLEEMIEVARRVLAGRTMNVNELRDAIHHDVAALSKVERPSGAHADMPEPLFRAIGTSGVVCIVAGRGTDAELARSDQWLPGRETSATSRAAARDELTRRFLHVYGPATPRQFAEWAKLGPSESRDAFHRLGDEIVDVGSGWVLSSDEGLFASPPQPEGVRLLPVQDPYLQQRDRAALVPDESLRRRLWKPVRGPGAVLVDGEIVATWRLRGKGKRAEVEVEPEKTLGRPVEDRIAAEAQSLAPFREANLVEVSFAS